jgi:hypothetical protein
MCVRAVKKRFCECVRVILYLTSLTAQGRTQCSCFSPQPRTFQRRATFKRIQSPLGAHKKYRGGSFPISEFPAAKRLTGFQFDVKTPQCELVENLPPLGCLLEALFPYHSRTIHDAALLCVSLKAIFISIYQEGIFRNPEPLERNKFLRLMGRERYK